MIIFIKLINWIILCFLGNSHFILWKIFYILHNYSNLEKNIIYVTWNPCRIPTFYLFVEVLGSPLSNLSSSWRLPGGFSAVTNKLKVRCVQQKTSVTPFQLHALCIHFIKGIFFSKRKTSNLLSIIVVFNWIAEEIKIR